MTKRISGFPGLTAICVINAGLISFAHYAQRSKGARSSAGADSPPSDDRGDACTHQGVQGSGSRVVGVDIAVAGTKDEGLVPLLHRLAAPAFFSLDQDFFRPDWAHRNYAPVWLDAADDRAAEFIRRFIRHALSETQAKRMGVVGRVHAPGVVHWRGGNPSAQSVLWPAR
jgi:hypothetical protein